MKEHNKNGWKNTDSPFELFKAAQRDIITKNSEIKNEDFQFEYKVETICRCATESAEKMLKGWIINKNDQIKVFGIHDLGKLYVIASNMNSSFSELKDKLNNLNNYTTELRYNSRFTIEQHEVKTCLKNLKDIYDFPLIKEARDKLSKEKQFNVLPDDIGTLFGKYYQTTEP